MTSEPVAVALKIVELLDTLGIIYCIGGSFASGVYGRLRLTQDIDIVAKVELDHIPLLVEALSEEFYVDANMMRGAIMARSSFNLIHLQSMFKVDIFIPADRPFDRSQLDRRRRWLLDDDGRHFAFFASPEDTVLAKLEWFRLSGEQSARQWDDVIDILARQKSTIDLAYMSRMADSLQITDLLDRALAEVEPPHSSRPAC